MSERWRPVVGWEGYYSVSDLGRVRSEPRTLTDAGGGRTRHFKGRVLKTKHVVGGYRGAGFSRGFGHVNVRIHTLVLTAFVGPCPDGMEVRHLDGDPANNTLVNLRWGTHGENTFDQVGHGTHNMARKTHCVRDHALVAPNLVAVLAKEGRRGCLACNRASARVSWYRRKYGQVLDMQATSDAYYEAIMGGLAAA